MKYSFILLSIIFLLTTCTKTPDSVVIEGKIIGTDGKPPVLAHINITKPGQSIYKPDHFIQVDSAGCFKLELKSGKYWNITCAAAYYQPFTFPLVLKEKDYHISFEIQPAPYVFKQDLSETGIIGEWNNWDFSKAQKMQKLEDGTFQWETTSDAEEFSYQIVNATKTDHSINGTQFDYLRYDNGGDYEAVLKVPGDKKVKIIFNPALYPKEMNKNLPKVIFSTSNTFQNEIVRMHLLTDSIMADFNRHSSDSGYAKAADSAGFWYSEERDYFRKIVDNSEDSLLIKYAALELSNLSNTGMQIDSSFFRQVTQMIPLSDTLWAYHSMLILPVYFNAFGVDKARLLLEDKVTDIPERLAQGLVFVDLGYKAKSEKDFKKNLEIHKILYYNFADFLVLRPFIDDLDPRKARMIGQSIPPFDFPIFKQNKYISDQKLKGAYYLIFFWSRYQQECVQEMKYLHDAYNRFKSKNFKIVAINFDPFDKDLINFKTNEWPLPWINVQTPKHQQKLLMDTYNIRFLPTIYLVDPEGIIIASNYELRGPLLEETLKKHLKTGYISKR
ncbi:MAG: redoxin domain-containing protein [Calditrichaceae bacterium]|nr:redoxin domain-containing protein [Calditrichaceae bacterium]MBN2707807.1 redoxin domain-containing protein [Calditrichaceae bacterium]RQV96268.1 MAG: hypothetical protein EH224_04885 [Calditrichota bacterium]